MMNFIIENVNPVTKIITGKWKAYARALSNMPNFYHDTANHSVNFVNPNYFSVHTQNIEDCG